MKTCIKCGKEKAVSEFYTGGNRCKVCRIEYQCKYQKSEKGKVAVRKYQKSEKGKVAVRKKKKKSKNKIKIKLLGRLHCFLIRGIDSKLNRETMGCTRAFFRAHYESLFKSGMTWENYGKEWESDHIKEMKTFDLENEETHKECMHWSNLQPQWKSLNRRNIH